MASTLSNLDQVTKVAVAFCLAIVAVRGLGGGSAKIIGITVDSQLTISVLMLVTAAHVLLMNYLLIEIARGWRELDASERKDVFDELSGATLLTRGLYEVKIRASEDWLFFHADPRRPFGTLYLLLYMLCVLACVEFTLGIMLPLSLALGLGIASFNWRIASSWITAFVDFGHSPRSLYFQDDLEPRPRYLAR